MIGAAVEAWSIRSALGFPCRMAQPPETQALARSYSSHSNAPALDCRDLAHSAIHVSSHSVNLWRAWRAN